MTIPNEVLERIVGALSCPVHDKPDDDCVPDSDCVWCLNRGMATELLAARGEIDRLRKIEAAAREWVYAQSAMEAARPEFQSNELARVRLGYTNTARALERGGDE